MTTLKPARAARRTAGLDLRHAMVALAWLVAACQSEPAPAVGIIVDEATIAGIHEAFRAGQLSAVQLTQVYLERIEAEDRGERGLHAVLTLSPGALARAQSLDESFAKTGQLVGALHGIPVLVEDNLDTFDMPTSAGLLALAESVPPDDAFVVKRLRDAGAIILGKTNMMELGVFTGESCSSAGGATRNAYDRERSSLGSSGGSAVAVAANLAMVAIGTDTSASMVAPAAANGVVGVRPSFGLVSRDGMVTGLDETSLAGPIARTVEDAALVLRVIEGEDPADPATRVEGRAQPARSTTLATLSGARVALVRELVDSSSFGGVSAPVAPAASKLVIRALGAMRAAGASVSGVSIAAIDRELSPLLARRHEDTAFTLYVDRYLATLGPDAPVRSMAEIVASGELLPELVSLVSQAIREPTVDQTEAHTDVVQGRALLRERLLALLNDHRLDVLVYLTIASPAQVPGAGLDNAYGVAGQLSAFSGLPSLTVPIGMDHGLPLGLTILGRPFRDAQLLRIAQDFEQVTKYREPPRLE